MNDTEALSMNEDDVPTALPKLLPRLWRFALRLTQNHHDAEDLVQRACVRALERKSQFLRGSSMLSWLFSIVHSTWLNEVRARSIRNRNRVDWLDDDMDAIAAPAGLNPEIGLTYRQIIHAVESLPDAQRIVMVLVAIEGLGYREAAEVLQVPIGTVMSRLSRARLAIGQQFEGSAPPVARKGQTS